MVNPAMIKKGIEIAGTVVNVSKDINAASEKAGINQDSIFAENAKNGAGPLNGVLQAADTVTGGTVGKAFQQIDGTTGGTLNSVFQTADKTSAPALNIAAAVTGGADGKEDDILAKLGKKMPGMDAEV